MPEEYHESQDANNSKAGSLNHNQLKKNTLKQKYYYKIYDSTGLSNWGQQKLMSVATKAALITAFSLFILKTLAWLQTSSLALKLSCIDSAFDIGISFVNFFVIRLTSKEQSKYLYGYDKAAALAALSQSVIIMLIILYTLYDAFSDHEVVYHSWSIVILGLSLFMSALLISFQQYVVARTRSMIVAADMMHYQTDFFINTGAMLSLIIARFVRIWWLDSILAIAIGMYLLFGIAGLLKQSVETLMDKKIESHEQKYINKILHELNIHILDMHITFSGIREIIHLTIALPPSETLSDTDALFSKIHSKIDEIDDQIKRIVYIRAIPK